MHKALTIAGLDSGGGAGIIADIKTFSALGVWGMAAVTSITAQNTVGVLGIQDLPTEMIKLQIRAVVEDIGVDAAKTGMLHTVEIMNAVAEEIYNYDIPLIVDPVMIAKSGAKLMSDDAKETLIKRLIPLAKVLTPNIPEAEEISGIKIKSIEDMEKAAKYIVDELGCKSVLLKGGHLQGKESLDILYYNGKYYRFSTQRIITKNTHGTGCTYSAAITAEIAKGKNIVDAVKVAKEFIYISILYGLNIGKGHGPVNHMAWIYREAQRYEILKELERALERIESNEKYVKLVPEVGMNIALASSYAVDKNDIAAIPGRIRKAKGKARACCYPDFGASHHLASYILMARQYDKDIRAAINIKYDEEILDKLRISGLIISSFDRSKEPEEIRNIEGMTIPWGTKEAIKKVGRVPDVIFHRGDVGKEPMIVILGRDIRKLLEILESLA